VSRRARVYVPAAWDDVAAVASAGLPAGTPGYAATDALAEAIGLPPADGPTGAERTSEETEDLHAAAAQAAADAALLRLHARGGTARRVVLVADAAVDHVAGPDEHPAAVRLGEPVPWSRLDAVLADDATDVPAVTRALRELDDDEDAAALDRAVAVVEDVVLGWFAPSEVARPGTGA
jgi:hypothetical protein